jgi:hypothetical protein
VFRGRGLIIIGGRTGPRAGLVDVMEVPPSAETVTAKHATREGQDHLEYKNFVGPALVGERHGMAFVFITLLASIFRDSGWRPRVLAGELISGSGRVRGEIRVPQKGWG